MNLSLFAFALILPVALPLASLAYLRPILRKVLTEICGTSERAEFWIRSATILSVFGALILVLAFGPRGDGADVMESLRWVLILTLAGAFVGIAWIARAIWRSCMVRPEAPVSLAPSASKPVVAATTSV